MRAECDGEIESSLDETCSRSFESHVTLTDGAADSATTIAYGLTVDFTLTATPESLYSVAWVLNASAGNHLLSLALEDGGAVVNRAEPFVRAGWVSEVLVAPLTRAQQAALDP